MAKTTSTQMGVDSQDITVAIATIQTNIEFIKTTLEKIENEQKLAATLYLKLVEFETYKKDVDKREVEINKMFEEFKRDYATKEHVKPALTFTYTILGVLGTAIIAALAAFILRGGLQ